MKNLTIAKFAACLFLLVGMLTACVEDNKYDTPQITCNEPDVKANITIAEVKAMFAGNTIQITSDLIIEGYVTSSDETGNFYGSLHFQDALENPTIGFQLDTKLPNLYTKYPVGSKILINLNGLYLGDYNGVLKVGGLYDSYGTLKVGRLSSGRTIEALYAACDEFETVTPVATTIGELNDTMINMLIKLENIEIAPAGLCQTYAVEGTNTDISLQDCNGDAIILRNSGYADFQAELLPNGSGTLVAVLSKYKKDYQLTIRDTRDVVMNDARCDGSTFSCEAPEVNATIQDVKDLFTGDLLEITDDLVFEGTVTANDIGSNLYKYIYLQDETGGLRVKINQKSLYLRGYAVGQKVTVKVKDLYIGDYGGEIQLGGLYNGKIGNMDESVIYKHLFIGEENAPLEPTILTFEELTEAHVGLFVKFEGLQFMEEGVSFYDTSDKYGTSRTISNCNASSLTVYTSKFAKYNSTMLPSKNGTVYGIVNIYNGKYQLLIRDANDFAAMQEERCDIYAGATLMDLSAVKAMFSGSKVIFEDNVKIKAVITSDGATGNIYSSNGFAQDATAAIALRFKGAHNLAIGTEVEIALKGVELSEYKGLLQLNYIPVGNIISTVTGTLPDPTVISLEEALSGDFEAMLVSITGVEFKDIIKTFEGNNAVTDCTNELKVYVSGSATFKDTQVSVLKGTITGVMSEYNTPQLYIRDANDVVFADVYEECAPVGGSETMVKLFFSECTEGVSNNKYFEIFNPSTEEVSLANYAFSNVSNAPTIVGEHEFWNNFDVDAVIPAGGFYIVSHGSADPAILAKANQHYNFLSNGDDGLALVFGTESSHVILDRIGDFQGDPGAGWDVAGVTEATKDNTLVRKSSVTEGNADWTASAGTNATDSEWIVKDKNDWSGLGVR